MALEGSVGIAVALDLSCDSRVDESAVSATEFCRPP